jgi:RTX calcium-binding nonapeptide repeat (4 copies)
VRRFSLLSLVAAAVIVAAPSAASAATHIGQTVDPSSSNCTANGTFLQENSPGNRYAVPFDGVITSWSFLGGSVVPNPLKLKVGTVGPTTLTIVGESAFANPAPNQLNTFSTRIPARAHDTIGFSFPTPADLAQCAKIEQGGYSDVVTFGDIPPGQTAPANGEHSQLDVSANLEPDCDKDGLGDETQDPDTSSCPPCHGQRATIVGTPRNDVLSGAAGRDVIVGLGGNDKLSGLGGNDVICGGPGKDTRNGGKGNDKLYGDAGKDTLKGGPGKDKLVGGPGKDKQTQ